MSELRKVIEQIMGKGGESPIRVDSNLKESKIQEIKTVDTTDNNAQEISDKRRIGTRPCKKKSFVEIRNRIINSLREYPKNIDQVRKDIHVSHITAQNHLEYLRDIGAVRIASFRLKHGEKQLWEITRK